MLGSPGLASAAFRLPERVAAVAGGVRDIVVVKGSIQNGGIHERFGGVDGK